jgi:hypothetical protein
MFAVPTIQHVLTGVFMRRRYSLPRAACKTLGRELPALSFLHDFVENVIILTTMFSACLNHLTAQTAQSAAALGHLQSPFQTAFDHDIAMLPKRDRPEPLSFLRQLRLTPSRSTFFRELQTDRLSLPGRAVAPLPERLTRPLPRSVAPLTGPERVQRQLGPPVREP